MSVDPRFYALSLTAVFLALGIGLLIGTALPGGEGLDRQQEQIVEELEQSFRDLRSTTLAQSREMDRMSRALEAQEALGQAVLETLVSGALEGQRILILEVGHRAPEAISRALQAAGASVSAQAVLEAENSLNVRDLGELVESLANPSRRWAMERLSRAARRQEVFLRGPLLPADMAVVWVSAPRSARSARSLETVVAALSRAGVRVVAVSALDSSALLGAARGVSTVDCVDMAVGQAAMVFALAGSDGHWGLGEDALGPLPVPGEPQ
jgi:hypothetical protein